MTAHIDFSLQGKLKQTKTQQRPEDEIQSAPRVCVDLWILKLKHLTVTV